MFHSHFFIQPLQMRISSAGLCVPGLTHMCWSHLFKPIPHYSPVFFNWQKDHPSLFEPAELVTNIAMLFSKQTRDLYGGNDPKYYINEWAGWSETLIEENIPFEIILDEDLEKGMLDKYDLLIVPQAVCLSDGQLKAMESFLTESKKLILTGETGTRTQTGALRENLAVLESLREKAVFEPEIIGPKYLLGYQKRDVVLKDPRDPQAKQKILRLLNPFLNENLPWTSDVSDGFISNLYQQKDGDFILHVINVSGTPLPEGKKLGKDFPLSFPVIENIPIQIKGNSGDFHSQAWLYSLEKNNPDLIPITGQTDSIGFVIPKLTNYAIVQIEKRK